jgi:hypothetical protein
MAALRYFIDKFGPQNHAMNSQKNPDFREIELKINQSRTLFSKRVENSAKKVP